MKLLFVVSLITLSFSTLAESTACRKIQRLAKMGEVQFQFAQSVGPGIGYEILSRSENQNMPSALMPSHAEMAKYCHGAFVVVKFTLGTKKDVYQLAYSVEDSCDGGNTFGNIVNLKTNKEVGTLQDGDVLCE